MAEEVPRKFRGNCRGVPAIEATSKEEVPAAEAHEAEFTPTQEKGLHEAV